MILLTATTDKIQVISSSASALSVHASYMDCSNADPPVVKGSTSGRTNTAIASAGATTDIVPSPAASTIRNVKGITVRNKDATTACDVTVQFNQNATLFELFKVTLLAGETLEFVEGVGFFVVKSSAKIDVKLRVTSDYINATTSFTDITGLTYPVESGKHYNFIANLYHIENAATTGAQFGINGPAMTGLTIQELGVVIPSVTAATMQGNLAAVTALDTAAIVATASATTPGVVMAILSGWFNPSAAGTFAVRGKSEVAVAAGLTVKTGSWLRLWEAAA